jgi:hypothetical protein
MKRISAWFARMPLSIAFGVLLGLLAGLSNDSIESAALDLYDRFNPVLVTNATIFSATPDEVLLAISGDKRRPCEFRRPLQAFGTFAVGAPIELSIERVDKPEFGTTRPLGPFNAGLWRIWPRGSVASVQVYSTHVCSGRVVTTLYADVRLP